jgi:hypothetical protein
VYQLITAVAAAVAYMETIMPAYIPAEPVDLVAAVLDLHIQETTT